MKMAIIFAIIFLIVSASLADGLEQGIRVKCLESDAWFEVTSYNLINGKPATEMINADYGEKAYFDNDKHMVECNIGKYIIRAEFQNNHPRERGQCGAAPGANITVWINGKILIDNGLFNNGCFDSLEKIKFMNTKWESEGLIFEICGHTGGGSNPRVDGCFEFKRVLFESIKLPLPPFSELISIKLFNIDVGLPKSNK